MFLSFKSHIYLESSMSFSFCLFLNEFLWLPNLVLNFSCRYQNICLLLDCCQWELQLNRQCLMINVYHLRDRHYLRDYKFVCLCCFFLKCYCCAFWLVFPYYPCNCSLLLCYFYYISYGGDVCWNVFNQF